MVITRKRIKMIERALNIDKPKEPLEVIIIQNSAEKFDKKIEKAFIDYKLKQMEKKREANLLPFRIIVLDKKEVRKSLDVDL